MMAAASSATLRTRLDGGASGRASGSASTGTAGSSGGSSGTTGGETGSTNVATPDADTAAGAGDGPTVDTNRSCEPTVGMFWLAPRGMGIQPWLSLHEAASALTNPEHVS